MLHHESLVLHTGYLFTILPITANAIKRYWNRLEKSYDDYLLSKLNAVLTASSQLLLEGYANCRAVGGYSLQERRKGLWRRKSTT